MFEKIKMHYYSEKNIIRKSLKMCTFIGRWTKVANPAGHWTGHLDVKFL